MTAVGISQQSLAFADLNARIRPDAGIGAKTLNFRLWPNTDIAGQEIRKIYQGYKRVAGGCFNRLTLSATTDQVLAAMQRQTTGRKASDISRTGTPRSRQRSGWQVISRIWWR